MSIAEESVAFAVGWITVNSSGYLTIEKQYQHQQKKVRVRYDRRLLRVCCGAYCMILNGRLLLLMYVGVPAPIP